MEAEFTSPEADHTPQRDDDCEDIGNDELQFLS